MRSAALVGLAALAACSGCSSSHTNTDGAATGGDAGTSPAGRSCEPVSVPPGGFDSRELYLEASSPSCTGGAATSGCMVYQLDGDPRSACSGASCADPDDVALRVFCTCRCSGDTADVCSCPDDMTCVDDVVTTGGAGVRGGYCVRTAALGG